MKPSISIYEGVSVRPSTRHFLKGILAVFVHPNSRASLFIRPVVGLSVRPCVSRTCLYIPIYMYKGIVCISNMFISVSPMQFLS